MTRSVMKYKILRDEDCDTLSKVVNEYIGNGWQPLGGVVIDTQIQMFYQTMVVFRD